MMALPGWKKCEENTLFVQHEAFGKSCDRYPQRSAQVSQISLFTYMSDIDISILSLLSHAGTEGIQYPLASVS